MYRTWDNVSLQYTLFVENRISGVMVSMFAQVR